MTEPQPDHLIWRLRNNDTAKHLCSLAADEIERLRAVVADRAAVVNDAIADKRRALVGETL